MPAFDSEEQRQADIIATIRNMTANPGALSDPRTVKAMEQATVDINAAVPDITKNIHHFFDKLDQKIDGKSDGRRRWKLHR